MGAYENRAMAIAHSCILAEAGRIFLFLNGKVIEIILGPSAGDDLSAGNHGPVESRPQPGSLLYPIAYARENDPGTILQRRISLTQLVAKIISFYIVPAPGPLLGSKILKRINGVMKAGICLKFKNMAGCPYVLQPQAVRHVRIDLFLDRMNAVGHEHLGETVVARRI